MSQEPMYHVNTFPHVIGGAMEKTDSSGKTYTIRSKTLQTVLPETVPPKYQSNIEELIEKIHIKVLSIGFSSAKYCGVDEFTLQSYPEDVLELHEIPETSVKDIHFPYNNIQCHPDNRWMFECARLDFLIENSIIPYPNIRISHGKNLPEVINFSRSDGSVQKGILKNNHSVVIRQSKSYGDTFPRMYFIVYFSVRDPEETQELLCDYRKSIPWEDIKLFNPDITSLEIQIPQLSLELIEAESKLTPIDIKKGVMTYFNEKMKKWTDTVLVSFLEKYPEITIKH